MTNIPKYRAKKIDSDEYLMGDLISGAFKKTKDNTPCCYILDYSKLEYDCFEDLLWQINDFEIDPLTMSINFSDMLDSENNPIFASLSESGKGGDSLKYNNNDNNHCCYMSKCGKLRITEQKNSKLWHDDFRSINFKLYKTIVIQK